MLMKCGCAANGQRQIGEGAMLPACLTHGITEPAPASPNLADRQATCEYCTTKKPSSLALPFFSYRAGKVFDSYYCGCRGWD